MDSPAAERMRGDERRLTWDEQRASERARYTDITARKVEYRRELRETGLAPQIASLAAFRAAQVRVDLRDAIANDARRSNANSISSSAKRGASL